MNRLARLAPIILPWALALASCDALQGKREAELMLQTLADAPSHGFSRERFPIDGLGEALEAGDARTRAAAVERLRVLIIDYAKAQRGFDVRPRSISRLWSLQPQPYDAERAFNEARRSHRLDDWLAGLPPPQAAYEALRSAYAKYARIAESGGWPTLAAGAPLALGSRDPRVSALRERLAFEDDLMARAEPTAPFDADLSSALSRFQARHGLPGTGIVDAATLAALNTPASVRVEQIRANLARWRWAARVQSPTRIDVNIAAAVADVYLDNRHTMHMRVAVGRLGDETPLLSSQLHSVVLNPTWSVPDSIASGELLPREERDPGYLARNNFTIEEGESETRLVQRPGAGNALGRVKFLFESPYAVYLHDTPSRSAFALQERTVSHGCVRLERALDLANVLLAREGWTAARIADALASAQTVEASLSQPVAVNISYWTAFVEGDQLSFRDDVYGWDSRLLAALDAEPRRSRLASN